MSEQEGSEVAPISLIRQIQSGELSAKGISSEARRACVEHLNADGHSAAAIAEMFRVSVRTIRRDIAEIREERSVQKDPKLVERVVGDLFHEAECTIVRLRRTARDRECPHATQVEAERACWEVKRQLVETLQRLGFLPSAIQQLQADVTHRIDHETHAQELAELESIATSAGLSSDEEVKARLVALHQAVPSLALPVATTITPTAGSGGG